jgi:modification methylase
MTKVPLNSKLETRNSKLALPDAQHLTPNAKLELDLVHQGDCLKVLASLPEKCVDLIFADPPYNLQLKQALYRPNQTQVDAVDDAWDQFASFAEYDQFTREWLTACRRVLKDTGALWVIGTYHNIHRVGAILQDLGYWILNDVAWVKTNPMPQFRGVRFCNAHETLIWAKKSQNQKKYTFNYQSLKAGNDDLQLRSDWYLPLCNGTERLRNGSDKVHATQKPAALLHRVIRACTKPGDVILDPFFGTGTSGAVAKRLGRHYIGIEREEIYVNAARERLLTIEPVPEEALQTQDAKSVARIPFAMLLELGLLQPGDQLRLLESDVFAVVNADCRLSADGQEGSIHRLGARLLGTQGCNGWDAWQYRDGETNEFQSIDLLRKQARAIMTAEHKELD